jgi:DNA-binding beta-propeller fold protein YncE
MMYVIDGTELIDSFRVGWGPRSIAIDPIANYVYVAHEVPNEQYPHNISVFVSGTTPVTTTFTTAGSSEDVAVDPLSGYAYVANRDNNTVTVLYRGQLIGTAPVGIEPWAVTVDPATGYAFVANRGSNSVTIFKDGLLVTTLPVGQQPSEIGIDPVHGYVYVVNESFEIECNEHDTCWTVCNEPSVTILD